jgi:hypothetical protein
MSGRRVLEVLKELPLDDRLAVLVLAIVECNSAAEAVGIRLAEVTGRMSERLNRQSRYRVADKLRDVADRLEQRQQGEDQIAI